ncbi:MAG: hypothetical protein DRP08_04355 [Candidatus Aenigmatarchaeota archaeon]|nr:MAG: hypothetical protein DRP08_04355 [Candidatus Aenigmarchaeota archaeon]
MLKRNLLWMMLVIGLVIVGGFAAKILGTRKSNQFLELPTKERKEEIGQSKISPQIKHNQIKQKINQKLPSLNLRLIGVIIGKPSLAFIKDLDNQQESFYRENDIIKGAKIVKIKKGGIILSRKGKREILLLTGGVKDFSKQSIIVISPTERVVNRARVNKEIEDIDLLLKEVKILPYIKNGKIKGWLIKNSNKENIIAKGGIENEDIITTIGGKTIDSFNKIAKLYKHIKEKQEIEVDLLRGNESVSLNYRIKN